MRRLLAAQALALTLALHAALAAVCPDLEVHNSPCRQYERLAELILDPPATQ